jgi:hypothetical protein|tara:strand:- start:759 stop:2012 length:1254 start_codon:yes stop_codon:yes gene_type:complete
MVINSFKNYLVEEEKTVYFTFGRMNPPTIGHEKLLNSLASKAGKNPYRVYLSQTQDKNKNPLNYKDKIKTARKIFPKHARSIILNNKLRSVFEIVTNLYNEGFKNIIMIVGSDRIQEFDILLRKYNGQKGKHGFYNFNSINVASAGDRDPDAEGASGMSASKMREAASNNDYTAFSQGLPKGVSNPEAKKLFNSVRKGMGLKEQKDFTNTIQFEPVSEEREQYVAGDLFQPGDFVEDKNTHEKYSIKYLGANHVIVEDIEEKTHRKWLNSIQRVEQTMPKGFKKYQEALQYMQLKDVNEKKGAEDPDIGDRKGSQPVGYHKGLKKSTKIARDRQFKKQAKMDDDNPAAYKPAPGDATAKTKPSVYTRKFKKMFGEGEALKQAKARIDAEKARDKIRFDRMRDMARTRDANTKNRTTS